MKNKPYETKEKFVTRKRTKSTEKPAERRNPDKRSEPAWRKPDKRNESDWVKRGQVWRTDKTQNRSTAKPTTRSAPTNRKVQTENLDAPGGYRHFKDIPAHRLGRTLRNELYKLANNLPEEENLNLKQRLKYEATTMTSSIASGFGQGSYRGVLNGALGSRGALCGVQDFLQNLLDQNCLNDDDYKRLHGNVDEVISAINQFIGQLSKDRS